MLDLRQNRGGERAHLKGSLASPTSTSRIGTSNREFWSILETQFLSLPSRCFTKILEKFRVNLTTQTLRFVDTLSGFVVFSLVAICDCPIEIGLSKPRVYLYRLVKLGYCLIPMPFLLYCECVAKG